MRVAAPEDFPEIDLDRLEVDPGALEALSGAMARALRAVPVARLEGRVVLAVADPLAARPYLPVSGVRLVAARPDAVARALARHYPR